MDQCFAANRRPRSSVSIRNAQSPASSLYLARLKTARMWIMRPLRFQQRPKAAFSNRIVVYRHPEQ